MTSLKLFLAFVPSMLLLLLGTTTTYKETVIQPNLEQRISALEAQRDSNNLLLVSLELKNNDLAKRVACVNAHHHIDSVKIVVHDTMYKKKEVIVKVPTLVDSDGVFYQRYSKMQRLHKIPSNQIYAIPFDPNTRHNE